MKILFSDTPVYKKRVRLLAILWTLLIFILCLIPGKEIPNVNIPMADKWVHFILFGTFAFLWLCTWPSHRLGRLLTIFLASVFTGWLVEELQGLLTFLGRSKDIYDILADSIGGALGTLLFYVLYMLLVRNKTKTAAQN